jgi:hypothetical protein
LAGRKRRANDAIVSPGAELDPQKGIERGNITRFRKDSEKAEKRD